MKLIALEIEVSGKREYQNKSASNSNYLSTAISRDEESKDASRI